MAIRFLVPSETFAQQAVADNSAASSSATGKSGLQEIGQLQEIVVTATKRRTDLQNTPISITAVTGAALLDRGISDFTQLAQEVPGVSMRTSGPGQTEFEMRGLSSNGGSSPTVGFYLDDVSMTPPALGFVGKTVVDPNLYDLDRVEVLRGPQGTLYGAGSMGGTIKLITNSPDPTAYHASAQTILSGTDGGGFNQGVNAMVNLPLITDQLAIRLVGSESHTSGWIDRIVLNPFPLETDNGANRGNILGAPVQADYKDVNSTNQGSGRIEALYTPTDRLSISAMLFDQLITQAGEDSYDSDPGIVSGVEAHYEPLNVPESYSDRFTMWSLNANYKFDSFDVTSVTSHWNRGATTTQDSTEVLAYFLDLPGYSVADGGIGPNSFGEEDKTSQFSEELRAASSGDGPLQWLGGLYYSSFMSILKYYSDVTGAIPVVGTNDIFDEFQPAPISQKAAFGNLTYTLVRGLKITAGARYYQYVSKVDTIENGLFSATGSSTYENIAIRAKNHGVSPMYNISYDVNKSLMVYATAARGFRPGGPNQAFPTSGPIADKCASSFAQFGGNGSSYNPDTVWSYELGEKFQSGNRITLDGDVYHETWAGTQQTVVLPCGWVFIGNAGTAKIDGGELEAKAFLTPHLEVSGNYGYSHAYFPEGNADTGTVAGQGVEDVPLMTASGAVTYFFPVSAGWEGSVRGAYDWTDGLFEPPVLVPTGNHELPAHGLADLRATVFNDRWTLTLFANNLTNKHAELEVQPSTSSPIPAYYRIVTNQPLTVGIDVNVKF